MDRQTDGQTDMEKKPLNQSVNQPTNEANKQGSKRTRKQANKHFKEGRKLSIMSPSTRISLAFLLKKIIQGRYKEAVEKFKEILRSHPSSPRALWGYAQATDVHELSGSGRSPISVMNSLVKNPDVPHGLLMKVIPKLIEKYVSEGTLSI